jgi:Mn2+/Fe2+ NRAMP family transporter
MGVLITAAVVLGPQHVKVDTYERAALMFVPVYGRWAVTLFALSLGVGCFGAAIEITLNAGYVLAQSSGWSWGADKKRRDAARFTAAFTVVLLLAHGIAGLGFDPLQVTLISVALTVVIMPIVVLPFLVLMNEERYVGRHMSSDPNLGGKAQPFEASQSNRIRTVSVTAPDTAATAPGPVVDRNRRSTAERHVIGKR